MDLNRQNAAEKAPEKFRDTKADIGFGILCILLGLLSLKALFDPRLDRWLSQDAAQDGIADLARVEGMVRKNASNSIAWIDVSRGSVKIADGDKVFTNAVGRATIQVGGKTIASIEPNSLIIVKIRGADTPGNFKDYLAGILARKEAQTVLDVKKGKIQLTVEKKNKPIVVIAKNKSYELRTDRASEDIEVDVTDDDKPPTITSKAPNTQVTVATKQLPTPAPLPAPIRNFDITLMAPIGQPRIVAAKDDFAKVDFEWWIAEPANPIALELEGADGSAKRYGVQPLEGVQKHVITLPVGKYQWRIKERAGEKSTDWESFEIQKAPPELAEVKAYDIRVGTGRKPKAELDSIPVALKWDPVKGAEKYAVVVKNRAGSVVYQGEYATNKAELKLKAVDAVGYTYHVSAKTPEGLAQSRKPASIHIEYVSPKLRNPEPFAQVDGRKAVLFTWQKTALTKEYELQVSKSRAFDRIFRIPRGKRNFFYFPKPDPGFYYWRTRAISPSGTTSPWSETREFHVIDHNLR